MILEPKTIDDIRANREEWATALESGKYRQTSKKLRRRGTMCCLGVLCDITDPTRWKGESWEGETKFPPESVISSVGLIHGNSFRDPQAVTAFSWANDSEGLSFTEIATMIRSLPVPTEVPQ